MKTRILTACAVALAISGCNEPQPQSSTPVVTSRPLPPRAVLPVQVSVVVDGGTPTQPVQVMETDTLALVHEHRGSVDHLSRARQLKGEGDLEASLTEARRAVFDNPGDEETLAFCAKVARGARQLPFAAEALNRLSTLKSDDAVPVIQRSRTLLSMGRFDEAITVGQEAIRRDPKNPEGYQTVGRAKLAKGELSGAIAMLHKAVELDPQHGYALNNLGFAYLRANENEKAVDVLTRASELLPSVAYVHNNLGVALERTGQRDEAKQAYGRATSLSPKYVKAKINSERIAKAVIDEGTLESSPTEESPVTDVTVPGVPQE